MENQKNSEAFQFTYSAKEQEEVRNIREKYCPKPQEEVSKLEQLRRLDASVTEKGTVASLVVGIFSTLVMGVGMCMCLVWDMYLYGIIVGVLGITGVVAAYPVYNAVITKQRQKLAPEIIRLTDKLMK